MHQHNFPHSDRLRNRSFQVSLTRPQQAKYSPRQHTAAYALYPIPTKGMVSSFGKVSHRHWHARHSVNVASPCPAFYHPIAAKDEHASDGSHVNTYLHHKLALDDLNTHLIHLQSSPVQDVPAVKTRATTASVVNLKPEALYAPLARCAQHYCSGFKCAIATVCQGPTASLHHPSASWYVQLSCVGGETQAGHVAELVHNTDAATDLPNDVQACGVQDPHHLRGRVPYEDHLGSSGYPRANIPRSARAR